jgi:hypothetical protein
MKNVSNLRKKFTIIQNHPVLQTRNLRNIYNNPVLSLK